jgi:hypothetical protein
MNLIPYIALWTLCALAVLVLALYRKLITFHGVDGFVHLADGEERLIPQQVAMFRKLQVIDRWGKGLTIFTAAFGFGIVAAVLFRAWQISLRTQ